MKTQINQNEVNVGVDVGKTQLDIFVRPLDIYFTVPNDTGGIKKAIVEIRKCHPTRIIIEATGRLELDFAIACEKAALPLAIINPAHMRKFAGAIGKLAKTDKLDAKLIAHYGEAIKPLPTQIRMKKMRVMSDLLARRKQLIHMRTMEKNRIQIMPKILQKSLQAILKVLEREIKKVDTLMAQAIEQCPEYQTKNDIIQSVPGVGEVVAFSLLSNMPELGYLNNKQAAALIGVAPINRESGTYKGERCIRGGRHQIRSVMFMAMLSAVQCNPIFKATYHRLVEQGKPKKKAIIACVRKMIVILNSMLRDGVMWDANMAKN